jgi:hypothetical protein
VEVVDEDMKQEVVPKVDILHLSYGGCGGQEGGAKDEIVPNTFASCEECQFNMDMEDEISAMRVLQNHKFVAHKRQEQDPQQKLCGRKGGRRRGAKNKIVPIINPLSGGGGLAHDRVQPMQETKVRETE